MRTLRRLGTVALPSAMLAAGLWTGVAGQRGLPASEGIINFGKVSGGLYRGAQPDACGIENLKRLGIKTIVNLRMTNDVWHVEEAAARTNGIIYTNIPLSGIRRPASEQVQKVLSLIETLPGPVFVHCEHGCDRTGTIVACYRIRHDRWTSEAALREANHYGMSRLVIGMRRFVEDFEKSAKGP